MNPKQIINHLNVQRLSMDS